MKIFFSREILFIVVFFVIAISNISITEAKNMAVSDIKVASQKKIFQSEKNKANNDNINNNNGNITKYNIKNKKINITDSGKNKFIKNNTNNVIKNNNIKNNLTVKYERINYTKKNNNQNTTKITSLNNGNTIKKNVDVENNKKTDQTVTKATINSVIDELEKVLLPEVDVYLEQDIEVLDYKVPIGTYIGAVVNGNKKDGYLLDLTLEKYSEGHWILHIKKNGFTNTKLFTTFLKDNSFFIDVDKKPLDKKAINFTYRISKDVRLGYQNQENNYRIVLRLPSNTKVVMKKISKEKILVNFINQNLVNKQKTEREQKIKQNILDIQKSNQQTILNNEKTIIFESETNGFSEINENITFGKINLKHKKPLVVVIDAGHGGIDPGAISATSKKEKNITLMYAKSLESELKKRNVRVVMTRKNDKTVTLLNRVLIAKNANADLFISIHADAHENSKASGTTVYRLLHLNNNHRDWSYFYNKHCLPKRYENINDRNTLDVLVGMAHQVVAENSSIMVDNILLSLKKSGFCQSCRYGKNSFAVLRGLDTLSILIEIGYITNLEEEKKILLASNVKKFAVSLADVIVKTFD